jgi:hypothetical protein
MKLQIIIKSVLMFILLGCLLRMPYSYYQITRFACFAGFAAIAYMDYGIKRYDGLVIGIAGAVLFNPLFKVTFKRHVWQTIDTSIAIVLFLWIIIDIIIVLNKKYHEEKRS